MSAAVASGARRGPAPRQQLPTERHRVPGEDAPQWLPTAFLVLGIALSAAAAWLIDAPHAARGPLPAAEATRPAIVADAGSAGLVGLAAGQVDATDRGTATAASADTVSPAAPALPAASISASAAQVTAAATPLVPTPALAPASAPAPDCPPAANVVFDFDSAALPNNAELPGRESMLRALALHPQSRLLVLGYADGIGADQYNLLLSFRRAKAVAALLEAERVPASRIAVRAAGSTLPAESGAAASAPQMRRVTVEVLGIPGCLSTS